ncbi:MAG: low molecular weight phosphatase family protein [Gammaproteobacteria bacterium]|jgi:protein-tyrosine-phosphatase
MKILFVCNANVGRSQAAEALFKRLSSLDAHSAGTRADEIVARSNPPTRTLKDSPSPAVPYLKELGVDISQNLRTQLTSEMVQQADKVIVMADKDNWPDYLRDNDKVTSWDIENTRGLGSDEARPLMDEIKRRVEELVREVG